MASHFGDDGIVSSQHAEPSLNVRAPAAVLDQARAQLHARNLEMRAFVVACLIALDADPDRMLVTLAEHWPAPKPVGRPRRKPLPASPGAVSTAKKNPIDGQATKDHTRRGNTTSRGR